MNNEELYSIDMLSWDLKIYILGFLEKRDIIVISMVSREWYWIANSGIIWQNLAYRDGYLEESSERYKRPPKCTKSWKDFYIHSECLKLVGVI